MTTDALSSTQSDALARPGRPMGVAAFPLIAENPYQQVLYRELGEHGFGLVADADFKVRWLWRARREVDFLHFHWPQNYYRWWRQPTFLASQLSWLKLVLFGARLALARAAGFTIVWTVHEVYPHERAGVGLDRAGSTLLARAAHVLIAHDRGTADRAAEELGISKDRIDVIPHGSYIGVYASGRSPRAVRDELGIDPDSFVFLCFGHLRAYKAIEVLLSSLDSLPGDIALIIAGVPLDEQTERSVLAVAARDERIKPILEFVPDERVAELFGASDAAVLPRGDGGTSGSLVLALSMGLAVVAAARPDYEELVGDAGWLFEAGNASSLAAALEQAASDRDDAARRGRLAHARAAELGWPEIAGRTASILRARRARKARRFA